MGGGCCTVMNKKDGNKTEWEGKTGGGSFGQNFLLWLFRSVGVKYIYPILYPIIPFYMLFGKKSRNSSLWYLRNQFHLSGLHLLSSSFKNYILFGQVVLDKFALIAGRKNQFKVERGTTEDSGVIQGMLDGEKGFIIAGAHVGCLELAGMSLVHNQKRINAIVFGGERAEFQKKRDATFHKSNMSLIPVSDDMSHLFTIKERLEQGEIVVIPCDRVFGSTKSVTCDFLEGTAQFPVGTFRLAAQLDVPIVALFIMKEKGTEYKVIEKRLPEVVESNSVKKAVRMTVEYVKILEQVVKSYPLQWFNFFPFWNEDSNKSNKAS